MTLINFLRRPLFVVRLGLEPRLFWTKTRRVASYTIGHPKFRTTNVELNFKISKNSSG